MMDLISGLSAALGVDPKAAEAIAGASLATVQAQAAPDAPQAAQAVHHAVPELGGWLDSAKALAADDAAAGGGMLGGLMQAANSSAGSQLLGALGGKQAQHTALLAGVLSKVGLDASMASMAAPVVLQFLQSRLDASTMNTLMSVAPFLAGSGAGGSAAGALGALGNMFSGD